MSDVLSRGELFPESVVSEMINMVKGKSILAALSQQKPIAFNGEKEFIFTMDREIDIVAENGAKTKGGISVDPVIIKPIKVEYGARVSDEFLYANEDYQLDILKNFAEGFAKKVAKGLDLMAFHGINPRTGAASSLIGTNHFDARVTQSVTLTSSPDSDVESAIELVTGSEFDVTGVGMSTEFRSALAKEKDASGRKLYPELGWGATPGNMNGIKTSAGVTLSANDSRDRAIIGDFETAFKWGYAKELPLEIIEYGNPDNDATLGDLKGHNQIYIRSEAYIGWGILVPAAFAKILAPAPTE